MVASDSRKSRPAISWTHYRRFFGVKGQLPWGVKMLRDVLQLFKVVRSLGGLPRISQIQFEFKLLALLVNHNDIFPDNYS